MIIDLNSLTLEDGMKRRISHEVPYILHSFKRWHHLIVYNDFCFFFSQVYIKNLNDSPFPYDVER